MARSSQSVRVRGVTVIRTNNNATSTRTRGNTRSNGRRGNTRRCPACGRFM